MFIEMLLAQFNLALSQYNCMWAYTVYQDWEDHKIDLTKEQAALMYNLYDIYQEESEKWYNTVISISNRRKRIKRQKKFFKEKLYEIGSDGDKILRIIHANRDKITKW